MLYFFFLVDFDLEEQLFSQCLLPNEGDENMESLNNNDMNVDDEEEEEEEEDEEEDEDDEEEENMEYDSRMYAH